MPNNKNSQKDQLKQRFEAQKAAFLAEPYPTADKRIAQLTLLESALKAYTPALKNALDLDFTNRSHGETELAEIMPTLQAIGYNKARIKGWMKPSKRHVGLLFKPAKAWVHYQPLGVVGIVVPWNYPIFLALGPLVTAMASGNRGMIKLSEYTPATNQVIRQLLESVFSSDEVAVIEGDVELSAAFSALPFDHLIFTGSTAVGRHVMSSAAKNLTPVTLELGGKSPAILTPEYPIETAVERILFGKTLNAGQTCIAPDYLFCHEDQLATLVGAFKKIYQKMYPNFYSNPDVTGIITENHRVRLMTLKADAERAGGTVVSLVSDSAQVEGQTNHRRIPLHLVLNPDLESSVMQEEIFGPLLPILTYTHLDQVVDHINHKPRPLALYLFSDDLQIQERFLLTTHSGGVCINDTLLHVAQDDLPFGGIGDSGIGHYHGHEGFLRLSHSRSVFKKGRINSTKLSYPPYRYWPLRLLQRFFGSGG